MARFLCTVSNVSGGFRYQAGQVYEAASNPDEDFFTAFGDDIKEQILGGFQRDQDGTLYLPGGGWDDLTFPATGINPPGETSDPTRSKTDGLLEFDEDAVNMIAGVVHLPHRRAFATKVHPHIHWYPADDTAGDVVWKFEYKICPLGAAIPTSYTEDSVTVAAPEAVEHVITNFAAFDPGDTTLGTILLWKLSRLGDDEDDTYDAVARLMEFDIHFWQDSIGSGKENSK